MGSRRIAPIEVDGDRPAVAWVTSLPAGWTTPRERLVLLMLALDTYDRVAPFVAAPRMSWLAAWTGEHRQRVSEAVASLSSATDDRPALLAVEAGGRRGNRYVLRTEVSAEADAFRSGTLTSRAEGSAELSVDVSAEVSARPDNLPDPYPLPSSDSLRSSASTRPRRRPAEDGLAPDSADEQGRLEAVEWYLAHEHDLRLSEVDDLKADQLVASSLLHPKAIANTLAKVARGAEGGEDADPTFDIWGINHRVERRAVW